MWLIDPAAHGGHRETDLAMLRLFGCPHLERVLASYREAAPLADGWADCVGLHQLFPLLVHAVLFGRGYGEQAVAVAREALARCPCGGPARWGSAAGRKAAAGPARRAPAEGGPCPSGPAAGTGPGGAGRAIRPGGGHPGCGVAAAAPCVRGAREGSRRTRCVCRS